MPKYTLTIEFETAEEARAHLETMTRGAPAEVEQTRQISTDPENRVDPANPEPEAEVAHDGKLDSEGMPFDPEIHSDGEPNKDGTWRAKRGKADEAKAARAAFKAAGGNVTPPAEPEVETAPEVEPAASTGMPGMPGMRAPNAAAPISFDKLFEKASGMMSRGVTEAQLVQAYSKAGVAEDPSVLQTNESARAAVYAALLEIEPEAAA